MLFQTILQIPFIQTSYLGLVCSTSSTSSLQSKLLHNSVGCSDDMYILRAIIAGITVIFVLFQSSLYGTLIHDLNPFGQGTVACFKSNKPAIWSFFKLLLPLFLVVSPEVARSLTIGQGHLVLLTHPVLVAFSTCCSGVHGTIEAEHIDEHPDQVYVVHKHVAYTFCVDSDRHRPRLDS